MYVFREADASQVKVLDIYAIAFTNGDNFMVLYSNQATNTGYILVATISDNTLVRMRFAPGGQQVFNAGKIFDGGTKYFTVGYATEMDGCFASSVIEKGFLNLHGL